MRSRVAGEPLFPDESLTTLRDRLTRMIERNEASGWPERNALPIVVRVRSQTPTGRLRDRFYQFDHVSAAMIGVGGRHVGLEVSVRAEHEVKVRAEHEEREVRVGPDLN
jgi:hypothetical protein